MDVIPTTTPATMAAATRSPLNPRPPPARPPPPPPLHFPSPDWPAAPPSHRSHHGRLDGHGDATAQPAGRSSRRSPEPAPLSPPPFPLPLSPPSPPPPIIWTNDNLVALQTLLEERDPQTHEYRYRGKVDLIYIDPPFMVNNDFRADNAIDLDLDEEVQAKKEPSLVEILAYQATPGARASTASSACSVAALSY